MSPPDVLFDILYHEEHEAGRRQATKTRHENCENESTTSVTSVPLCVLCVPVRDLIPSVSVKPRNQRSVCTSSLTLLSISTFSIRSIARGTRSAFSVSCAQSLNLACSSSRVNGLSGPPR